MTVLAKLHNDSINQSSIADSVNKTLVYSKSDEHKIFTNEEGFVAVNRSRKYYSCPDLTGGGKHFCDIPNRKLRHSKLENSKLPCTILHQMVIDLHKMRLQSNMK